MLRAVALALALAACTDFVFDQAPDGCGFPPDTELAFGGLASPLELDVEDAPVDRTLAVEAYVTEEPVELAGGAHRAACLALPDGNDVDYWVRPVPDDWQHRSQ